jgi:hypothetical protein
MERKMIARRRAILALTVLASATLSIGANRRVSPRADAASYQQRITRVSLVALLSPHCGCNETPAFARALETIRTEIRTRALAKNVDYSAVGLVLSDDVAGGVDYLVHGKTATGGHVEFSRWDEIHAGDGWRNEAMLSVVWEDQLVDAAFPQLVLIERQLERRDGGRYREISARQTLKLLGTEGLEQWISGGMILPDSSVLALR